MGQLPASKLNLHGLWPNNYDGSLAENCLPNNYDETKFESAVLDQLNTEWVGLYNPSSDFRNHEWGKHGTCWAQAHQSLFSSKPGFLGSSN
jgi:ribonuclease T2